MEYKIPFNRAAYTGNEDQYLLDAIRSQKISGDGKYSRQCESWFEKTLSCKRTLFTPSCTHALEMAALLIDVQPGDEVIMPSYTFVSTANAFVLRGAKIVFVDIRPDTMNIDEKLIEAAITNKTKAIVPVHYAGVACEMDSIMAIAREHALYVIEDAAQALSAKYKGAPLGTIGNLSAYSFHETKNITSGGEGGLLIINDQKFTKKAEIIREKGTNRSQYFRGEVDKYTWVDLGSSYLPSEIQGAYLWGQLENIDLISSNRMATWKRYFSALQPLQRSGLLELPFIPENCVQNAHMFYIKMSNLKVRTELSDYLKRKGILSVFHYVPLHSSVAGKVYGQFHGEDRYTTAESERLLRLPLYYGIAPEEVDMVIDGINDFFRNPNRIICI